MTDIRKQAEAADNPYIIRAGMPKDLTTLRALAEYQLAGSDKAIDDASSVFADMDKTLPNHLMGGKRRDTSLGGNDAVNCFYSFNENDDIIPLANRLDRHTVENTDTGEVKNVGGILADRGMGRVYSETFDDQQQLIHMSFGVADFTSIKKFYEALLDSDLAKLMNTGKYSMVKTVAKLIAKAGFIAIALPFVAAKWAIDFLSAPGITAPSKYYDFHPTMSLYFKMVNVILAHLGVNMGLTAVDGEMAAKTAMEKTKGEDTVEDISDAIDRWKENGEVSTGLSNNGVPSTIKKHGLDILTILSKKFQYEDEHAKVMSTEEYWNKTQEEFDAEEAISKAAIAGESQGIIENWLQGFGMGFSEALRYVSFRIEKGTDSSESASNSTKESSISQMMNSKLQGARDKSFNLAGLKKMGILGDALQAAEDAVTGFIGGITESIGVHGGLELAKGAGLIEFPEVWENSTFSKSYTFSFQLRTPFADKYSIFYSLYTQLAMIMAGAFPRSVGPNAYTSPFLVRAYAKGQFAIPLGIIDSLTITRGAAEYGWSKDMLPTVLDISFTIKDLAPMLSVQLADGKILSWSNIFGRNSSIQEYMLTLSGTGLAERTLAFRLLKKRAATLMKIAANNKFSARMMAFSITNTKLGMLATAFSPSRLPGG